MSDQTVHERASDASPNGGEYNEADDYSNEPVEQKKEQDSHHGIQPRDPKDKVYVPGYDYDIFVSFADVDDQPRRGAKEGWVTTLIKELKILLAQRLGSADAFSLWSNHQLPGNVKINVEITNILSSTATFIVVLSPGYLMSEGCKGQTNSFIKMIRNHVRAGSRVFVVERDRLEPEEHPPEFADLKGYQFWIQDREGRPPRVLGDPAPQRDEELYYERLDDLGYDLVKELRRLKASAVSSR